MLRRIYVDTSVVGGCLDQEFEVHSTLLFNRFRGESDILVLSDLTLAELQAAPDRVRGVLETVPTHVIEQVVFNEDASDLAEHYIASGIIGAANLADAQHIATATVSRVNVLVSWNFKHIVNLERIRGYNSVNLRLGHPLLEIRTPQEILTHED